jgi:nucleotide-binding universal stress UspA family protein
MGAESPLVVGYTGSPESRDAIALTRALAGALNAPVVAACVITAAPLETDLRTLESELRDQGERLRSEAAAALADVGDAEAISIPAPSPARELDRIAQERGAAMVVLGSTGRGPLRRIVPGTVADRLLAGGACPVAIAPRSLASTEVGLGSIAVGFDGTPESRAALAFAARLARGADASLDLIAVVDPAMPAELPFAAQGWAGLAASPAITREQIDRMWALAGDAVRELVPNEVAASVHVLEGPPAAVLAERSARFDLLVVGSRGYGPVGRVLAGSVSSALARTCECPLVVTPRPRD